MRLFKLILLSLILFPLAETLAATLDIDQDGLLIGATDVNVDGTLFELRFRDGTFFDIFTDASGLDATTATKAEAFSHALLDQVFLDTEDGLFDTDPELTFGCPNTLTCIVFTPFSVDGNSVMSITAFNRTEVTLLDEVRELPADSNGDGDFSQATTWVYADWTVQVVPIPAAAWLFGSALGLLGWMRRRTV